MRRWVMITTMNKRINSPIRKSPFPKYTPLDIIPNSMVLQCDDSIDNAMLDKDFLKVAKIVKQKTEIQLTLKRELIFRSWGIAKSGTQSGYT